MPTLLFVLPLPRPSASRSIRVVGARRPRKPTTCSSSPGFSSDPSDQTWRNLARSLGSSDSAPPRPAPEWKDQQEAPTQVEAEAWASWQSARAQQTPITERDPRKETDFWRTAAKELSESPQSLAGAPVDPNASSSEIWGLARGVTGEMADLQNKLRADLDRYNPEENTDQYRRIARELVGPAEDEWETISDDAELRRPTPPDAADVSPASGWNPDTDWKRFDDLRREEALKIEKDARADVARDAQKKRDEAFGNFDGRTNAQRAREITYTDENGKVMTPEEVKEAIEAGAVFVDESGSEILNTNNTFSGNSGEGFQKKDTATNAFEPRKGVPGFIANRARFSGTYGPAYSGAEEHIKELQREGIPLRDPKADTESWREAARELNIEVESDSVGTADAKEIDQGDAIVQESVPTARKTDHQEPSSQSRDDRTIDSDAAHSWKAWRSGNIDWMVRNADVAPRDPKQEVDMWRASAQELTSESKQLGKFASPEGGAEGKGGLNDSTAWNAWRDAAKRWESSLQNTDMNVRPEGDGNLWKTRNDDADWGRGLNSKTSSDRSAWENWNKVKGRAPDPGNESWWPAMDYKDTASDGNTEQWRSTASELVGNEKRSREGKNRGSNADGSNEVLDFWKTVARDMDVTEISSDVHSENGGEE
eukprot:GFKZ01004861.1.p1 GENE.GFKZ01004861.1~~GFKZ01004861.1.p1  ORF type:complete len:654 (+),score=108.58 GFKZ01004861.1:267-2228(+)